MAKGKVVEPKIVEEVAQDAAVEVAQVAETVVEETATVVAPQTKTVTVESVASAKTIKVMGLKGHSCRIAGVPYHIEKHKEYQLPEHVAAVLANALIVIRK